jgi:hypothetical protein
MRLQRLLKSDLIKLVLILGLAFFLVYYPHLNYRYPLHIDEWVHFAYSQAIMQGGHVPFLEPFFGGHLISPASDLELGFHIFLGVFQTVTGLSWMIIFSCLPAVIFIMIVLSTYVLGKRLGFGWQAAFFTALIPSTVGTLGPAFLVPVALGLLYIPLSLFVVFYLRSWWSYPVLFLFSTFLLAIHAPSAICLIIILVPYIIIKMKEDWLFRLGSLFMLVLPFLMVFPWIFSLLLPTAKSLLTPIVPSFDVVLPDIISEFGYIPVAFCVAGAVVIVNHREKRNWGLLLGLLLLLLMLTLFFTFHYGVEIVYQRGLMFVYLMIAVVAGVGMMGIGQIRWPNKTPGSKAIGTRNLPGVFTVAALAVVILIIAVPARLNSNYYYVIDSPDYQAFNWMAAYIPQDTKNVVDPWKATAFTAITGKTIYTRMHSAISSTDQQAWDFLRDDCRDTDFLKKNGISVIYSPDAVSNNSLIEIRKNVYLLKK